MLDELIIKVYSKTYILGNDQQSLSILKAMFRDEIEKYIKIFKYDIRKIEYIIIVKSIPDTKYTNPGSRISTQIKYSNKYTHRLFDDIDVLEKFKKL